MSRVRSAYVALAVVGVVLLAGCSGSSFVNSASPPATSTTTPAVHSTAHQGTARVQSQATRGTPRSYAALYRDTTPSVVQIRVVTPTSIVTGSGFVYDRRGDVVTNHHVIANARSVDVRFQDGNWENATVVGSDAYSDLAVVRVPTLPATARPLPIAKTNPRPGQPVAAIGNPFGLTGSITTGVISGVNRTMPTKHSFTIPGTVQTSAAINPGNSGGPLLSVNGTVVGVNRATRGVNVGFAISPVVIDHVVPRLIDNGTYTHAYLGVSTESVTPTVARADGLQRVTGVLVVQTLPNGPAAGHLQGPSGYTYTHNLRVPTGGDVIVAINGTAVRNGEALSRYLLLHTHPGERVPITVLRNGSRTTAHVTLGTRPRPR